MMRSFAVALLTAAGVVGLAHVAQARTAYPYCAVSRGADMGYEECAFATFELCLEEVRGLGGYCKPNARYRGPPPRDPTPPERPARRPHR
ncbi:MAG: DUF3551 domain-containing protein [Variibacter sp.]